MGKGNRFPILASLAVLLFGVGGTNQLMSHANKRNAAPKPEVAWVDQARIDNADSEPQNWMAHGGTYSEQRFSRLAQVNDSNVSGLKLGWSFGLESRRGEEATPLVIDGVMYISTAWSKVLALDAVTGRLLWKFDPQVPGESAVKSCCDVVNRGVAVWKGKVFVGTIDGRLIALDAATGRQIWSVPTTDPSKPYVITGAPRVFKNKVVIGNSGAEFGVRGYVTAYDTESGKQVWRFYTVPNSEGKPDNAASDPVMAMAAKTWFGKGWHESGGGGTVWDSIVYDPELDQLYIGVGNGAPWSRMLRSDGKGDNLFLASIVALDPDSGRYRWHYQATPGDSFDYTNTQQMTLATLTIGGEKRRVLMQAPKNGFFYVIDRTNGKLISAKNFAPVTWATDIDLKTGRPNYTQNAFYETGTKLIMPSSYGAHNWHPMSFSPITGLVYIPTMQISAIYGQEKGYKRIEGRMNLGISYTPPGSAAPKDGGALVAWDPVAQREVWRAEQAEVWNGGTLSTAGNLVFAGTAVGDFKAYRATDGVLLWTYRQQASIMAGPISYEVNGTQYIAVIAGYGGSKPLMFRDEKRPQTSQPLGRILVFKMGGSASLSEEDLTVAPANPPEENFTPSQVAEGAKHYWQQCLPCHGGLVLPDLRRSAALSDRETWRRIVLDGILKENGMVSFARWLKPQDAEAVRAYVASEARVLKAQEGDAQSSPRR